MTKKIRYTFKYMFLILVSFLSVFPFYWMIIGMTNSSNDVIRGKLTIGKFLKQNVSTAFNSTNLTIALKNSIVITVLSVLFGIVVSAMAAYGFQIFKTKFKDKVFKVYLISMMVPFSVLLVPMYKMIVKFGLLNNLLAVILPSVFSTFLIFFFYQSLENFPISTIESARIDGASELLIFFRIVVPQLKSTFAAASIYAFMTQWNNYLWPLIALQANEKTTIQLLISTISDSQNYVIDYGVLMVLIVLSTLPIFVIFITMQKHFVEGMVGASKG